MSAFGRCGMSDLLYLPSSRAQRSDLVRPEIASVVELLRNDQGIGSESSLQGIPNDDSNRNYCERKSRTITLGIAVALPDATNTFHLDFVTRRAFGFFTESPSGFITVRSTGPGFTFAGTASFRRILLPELLTDIDLISIFLLES